jgi:hypothetical protein
VIARKASAAHEIMEVRADCTPEQAQEAFHKIARTAHPDLHRKGLSADDLEMVTSAYAIVAGAYQQLRQSTMHTMRMKPLKLEDLTPPTSPPTRPTPPPMTAQAAAAPPPATPSGPTPAANAAQSMSPKALVYYRKAEIALRRGDLKGAVLQIKLAIAADPASGFLRTALAEVETEVRKST